MLAFFDKFDKSEELRRRIYGIDQVFEQFRQRVLHSPTVIGFKTDDKNTVAMAMQLNRELTRAREARVSFEKIQSQEKEKRLKSKMQN